MLSALASTPNTYENVLTKTNVEGEGIINLHALVKPTTLDGELPLNSDIKKWVPTIPVPASLSKADAKLVEYFDHREFKFKYTVDAKQHESHWYIKEPSYSDFSEFVGKEVGADNCNAIRESLVQDWQAEYEANYQEERHNFLTTDPLGIKLSKVKPVKQTYEASKVKHKQKKRILKDNDKENSMQLFNSSAAKLPKSNATIQPHDQVLSLKKTNSSVSHKFKSQRKPTSKVLRSNNTFETS